jgi:alpha-L-arabinofuranosidase
MKNRRGFLEDCCVAAMGSAFATHANASSAPGERVVIDPRPVFNLSPYLYMQFMEPLGVTDGSVAAAWDYDADDWRKELIDLTRDLAPGVVRFGGLFSRYYKWHEGVGPVNARPPMRNYAWGGIETNRVGTDEFVNFCRRVGGEPLYCVNFLSDGRLPFWRLNRAGDAKEAAEWVSYANDPDNRERRRHGVREPYNIKLWQLGNETSYGNDGFSKEESVAHTVEFAKAMKQRDRSIQLIGWGDRQPGENSPLWAGDLLNRAGEHLDCIAIHMMGQRPKRVNTLLSGLRYQREPEQAWQELLELSGAIEARIAELEEVLSLHKSRAGIAVTEGHLSLRPHNTNPILHEWLTGVYHAQALNIYQRHGARVRIATAADFCGTCWTVNAVMMQVPCGVSYLMPVGSVMKLFKKHNGKQGIAVKASPSDLDIAASRNEGGVYLHVANLNHRRSVGVTFTVEGMSITGGKVFEIAPADLRESVSEDRPDVFEAKEKTLPAGFGATWRFPPASVSAVELEVKA